MAFSIDELNTRYNAIVKSYLDRGFIMSPLTHGGGFSGTESHMDLIDPKDRRHLYRVWLMYDETKVNYETLKYAETLNVITRRYDTNSKRTIWPDEGELIDSVTYYVVKRGKAYAESIDEMVAISKRRYDRCRNKAYVENNTGSEYRRCVPLTALSDKFVDNIMAKINRVRGFKRASASCIKQVVLYKDSYYSYYEKKTKYTLKGRVDYSFNNKEGVIFIG